MTDDIPEQPVAGRLEYPGIELGSATIDLDTGEIVGPVGAAADDSRKPASADKTAFVCSALLALAARWLEEAQRCRETARKLEDFGQRIDAADIRARADILTNCSNQLRAEIGRAAEANEKLSDGARKP